MKFVGQRCVELKDCDFWHIELIVDVLNNPNIDCSNTTDPVHLAVSEIRSHCKFPGPELRDPMGGRELRIMQIIPHKD
jgi:hypothetical protein